MSENKQKYIPACVVWELTLACNLAACTGLHGGRAPRADAAEALRVCDGLAQAGCRGVALMGGGPCCGLIFEIAGRVRAWHGSSVITNGTVQSEDIFCGLRPCPMTVAVSLTPRTQRCTTASAGCPALRKTSAQSEGEGRPAGQRDHDGAC
jgi:MoaA/NifB/PqqE/SkfB family radical SAM enzyme